MVVLWHVFYEFVFCQSVMRKCFLLLLIILNADKFLFYSVEPEPEEKERIPYKFAVEPTLPGMVVFNVDELLWPFKVDKVMTPPLKATRIKHQIKDRMGKIYELFPETGPILEDLFTHWYKVGGLVQSTDTEKIEQLMNLFEIERFFKIFEVFPKLPGSKLKHMKRISNRVEVPLEDILYFDTDLEDLEEMETLKVITVHVDPKEGITYKYIEEGFKKYYYAKNETVLSHYARGGTAQPKK